ncbi:leucine-rich repeat domain-containing protein [Larkinella soli]|uniref:leucine-rich repeat domain-containing protein n=1 Tax=Larkinella soli TaxID=1770527 RepID=UPI000FFB17A4|nr:leucine-rich repeat domain-containing protein [Larkinella soli]
MKLTITLFCLLLCLRTLAQPVCLSREEHDKVAAQLARQYTLLADQVDPGNRTRSPGIRMDWEKTEGEKKMAGIYSEVTNAVREEFRKAGLLQDGAYDLMLTLYGNPDGSIRQGSFFLAVLGNRPDTAVQNAQEPMRALVCRWMADYRLPVTVERPFRLGMNVPIGKLVSAPRRPRRGPGIMATLEDARKTDRPDTVRLLALNSLGLNTVPEEIYRFPNLEDLDLSNNALTKIPAKVFGIPKLRQLNLTGNPLGNEGLKGVPNDHLKVLNLQRTGLTTIPKAILENRGLTSLWLGYNDLSKGLDIRLLRRLRHLNDLNLYRSNLSELPSSLGRLKRLEVLDLYYNQIRGLPEKLSRLRRLQQLAVSHNRLAALPKRIGKLRSLHTLYTHHNSLSALPKSIRKLRKLQILDISDNAFTQIPDHLAGLSALEDLNLGHNRLAQLPPSLGRLKNLRKLYLRGNPALDGNQATAALPVIRQLEGNRTEVQY